MATTSLRGSLDTSLHPSTACVSSFCAVQGRLIWSINSDRRPSPGICGPAKGGHEKGERGESEGRDRGTPGARRLRARVTGEKPSAQLLPGNGAVAVLEGAGRPVCGQGCQVDDYVRAFGDGLGAAVVVEIGAGVAGVGRVDEDSI